MFVTSTLGRSYVAPGIIALSRTIFPVLILTPALARASEAPRESVASTVPSRMLVRFINIFEV